MLGKIRHQQNAYLLDFSLCSRNSFPGAILLEFMLEETNQVLMICEDMRLRPRSVCARGNFCTLRRRSWMARHSPVHARNKSALGSSGM
jgi:hypothetical protein